jgi:hypothetical protein
MHQEVYDKLVAYAADDDNEALKIAMDRTLRAGECVMLKNGEKVFVQEIGIGYVLVRRKGAQLREYYTSMESVDWLPDLPAKKAE